MEWTYEQNKHCCDICVDEYVVNRSGKQINEVIEDIFASHPEMKKKYGSDDEIAKILLNAMKKDKKNSSDKVRFILQSNVGETVITEVPEGDILSVLK